MQMIFAKKIEKSYIFVWRKPKKPFRQGIAQGKGWSREVELRARRAFFALMTLEDRKKIAGEKLPQKCELCEKCKVLQKNTCKTKIMMYIK